MVLALALGTLACAGSKELARRSEVALQHGNVRKAYDTAKASLDRDPNNGRARASMTRAAGVMMDDWKQRLRRMAETDSLAAAEASLALDPLRGELARYRVTLPLDPAFESDLERLRRTAASRYYREADRSLAAGKPRRAYVQFENVRRYERNYRDVVERLAKTWELAVLRVAVLPLENQTGVPGLSRSLADRYAERIEEAIDQEEFRFTRLVPMERIYGRMTVAQLDRLDRDDAVRLGRAIGAHQVVWGRAFALRSDTGTDTYRETIFRKTTVKDTSGTREDWVEDTFDAISRERRVDARLELEVLGTDSGETLARDERPLHIEAHTVWSDFRPVGAPGDYALASPELRRTNAAGVRRAEQRWKDTFGDLTVPKMIERTRGASTRRRYKPEYAEEFAGSPRSPIYLDDVPAVNDLARLAFEPGWRTIVELLGGVEQE